MWEDDDELPPWWTAEHVTAAMQGRLEEQMHPIEESPPTAAELSARHRSARCADRFISAHREEIRAEAASAPIDGNVQAKIKYVGWRLYRKASAEEKLQRLAEARQPRRTRDRKGVFRRAPLAEVPGIHWDSEESGAA